MAIKCDIQNFSFLSLTEKLKGQSAVECRFPGEIATVLAVNTAVALISSEPSDGEIFYKGRVILTVIYEDADKNVCRSERGMEFSHTVKSESCTPSARAVIRLSAENVNRRREGSGLYISVVVGADISLYSMRNIDYVCGGEGIYTEKNAAVIPVCNLFDGSGDTDDEFETEYISDVLMHSENVNITDVSASAASVAVSGELNLNICAMKADNSLVSFERLIPFRIETECGGADEKMKCCANVYVESASVSAETDEEKGVCKMKAEFRLRTDGVSYGMSELMTASDAFSANNELFLSKEKFSSRTLSDSVRFSERVSGKATVDGNIDFSDTFSCVLLPSAEAEITRGEQGERIEGVLSATLVLSGADGAKRSRRVDLPFSAPFTFSLAGEKTVSVMPCGVSIRQKKEGEAEVDATLKFTVTSWDEYGAEYVSSVTEGEEIKKNESAVSMYVAEEDMTLWGLSKLLKIPPEEVEKNNPALSFPLRGGEKIFIYRQKKD